jgi:hypothetical protein
MTQPGTEYAASHVGGPWPPCTRRDVLRVGSLSVAASVCPAAMVAGEPSGKARSVILLWMAGGVTHIDSLDPKPDAPQEIRGTLGTIRTALTGICFSEVMTALAAVAGELAVLRSYSHDSNDHFLSQAYALSGRKVPMAEVTTTPNVGSIVCHLLGPRDGLPGYIAVPGTTRPGPPPHNLFAAGWLGEQYAPFAVGSMPAERDFAVSFQRGGPGHARVDDDLRLHTLSLPAEVGHTRIEQRQALRDRLDGWLAAVDGNGAAGTLDAQYRSAFGLLLSPRIRAAFDLERERPAWRDAYGRTKIGQRCLLARRLVEAGARYVMVDYGYDPDYGNLWDNHAVPIQRQPHIGEMARRPYHLAGTDRAAAALLSDLRARGMLDHVLVVFLTEFGRTPRINSDGGRDHWGAAGSIFFAGGGVRGGQVIGATDKHGAFPTGTRFTPADVAATIYCAIGIDPNTLLHDRQNRPIAVLPLGEPIPGVLA